MYGIVLDVVCLKTMKMRGQAFIFQERTQAAAALKTLQGKMFFGRPLVCFSLNSSHTFSTFSGPKFLQHIAYSKTHSYATLRDNGIEPSWLERRMQMEKQFLDQSTKVSSPE